VLYESNLRTSCGEREVVYLNILLLFKPFSNYKDFREFLVAYNFQAAIFHS